MAVDGPFDLIRRPDGREAARFVCTTCEAKAELPAVRTGSGKMNNEASVKRAEQAGWRIAQSRTVCPRCVAARAASAKGEQPGPKPTHPISEVVSMADTKAREPSTQERMKIRAILDKHFDDGAGCWLDGYSDQKAGEEAGVPWALVTRIREAAYGPIRVDPEVAALRAEMAQIARDIAALTAKHADATKRLDALHAKRAA